MNAPRFRALLLLAIALLCASLFLVRAQSVPVTAGFIQNGKINFAAAEQFWVKRIRNRGGTRAYQDLLTLGTRVNASEGHIFAHAFGDALFKTEGIGALSVCGQELFWGCVHQFVGDAVSKYGPSIIPQLDAGCAPSGVARTECEHGLGHGILSFVGYTTDDLETALAECDTIEQSHPRSGCSEGVFMEYELRELTSIDTGILSPRSLSEGIYTPCLDLPSRYRSACGFDLPLWWGAQAATYAPTLSAAFTWIASHCANAPDAVLKRSCEEGLGLVAYLTRGPAGSVYCEDAVLGAAGERECRAAFAGSMHPADNAAAQAACATAGAPDDAYCIRYAVTDERDREALPAP